MNKKDRSSWTKHIDFIFVDLIGIQISFALSYISRKGFSLVYLDPDYLKLGLEMLLYHLLIIFFTETYSGVSRRGYLKEFKAVVLYNILLLVIVFSFMFATQTSVIYSRIMMLYFFGINCMVMYVSHYILKNIIGAHCEKEKNKTHFLLITKEANVHKTVEKILDNKFIGIHIERILIVDQKIDIRDINGIPTVKTLQELIDYSMKNIVDEVFIDIYTNKELIKEITEQFADMGITTHINLYQISSQPPNTYVNNINGFTTLSTYVNTVTDRQRFVKRLIDISAGIVGLAATGIVLVLIAPIIYIQSPGPIFFSQIRVGKNGRKFRIYKFRSMYMDAEEQKKELMSQNKMTGYMFKIDHDPRIIPIGNFIRRCSIDELPQSINILRGDMSLVGTRPPTVDEYEKYKQHHKKRLAAKPGLTGMWQISGRSAITDFEEVVRLDTEYLATWNLSLDLKIILKTFGVVVKRSGAG